MLHSRIKLENCSCMIHNFILQIVSLKVGLHIEVNAGTWDISFTWFSLTWKYACMSAVQGNLTVEFVTCPGCLETFLERGIWLLNAGSW
jgi:hypothetical protein